MRWREHLLFLLLWITTARSGFLEKALEFVNGGSRRGSCLFDASVGERWEMGIGYVVSDVVAGVNCVWLENEVGVGDKKIEA